MNSRKELKNIDLLKCDLSGSEGMILECKSIIYPKELHELHNEMPMIAEKQTITYNDLSPTAQKIFKEVFPEKKENYKSTKLCTNFLAKKNYVAHAQNLKFYLQNGIKISGFSRGIKFKQSNFLKEFIDLCTTLRAQSLSEFEKILYKFIANSVFGKFIENARLYLDLKLVSNAEKLNKYCLHPFFKSTQFISPSLSAVISKPSQISLDKAYAVGFRYFNLNFFFNFYLLITKKYFLAFWNYQNSTC